MSATKAVGTRASGPPSAHSLADDSSRVGDRCPAQHYGLAGGVGHAERLPGGQDRRDVAGQRDAVRRLHLELLAVRRPRCGARVLRDRARALVAQHTGPRRAEDAVQRDQPVHRAVLPGVRAGLRGQLHLRRPEFVGHESIQQRPP